MFLHGRERVFFFFCVPVKDRREEGGGDSTFLIIFSDACQKAVVPSVPLLLLKEWSGLWRSPAQRRELLM